MASQARRGFRYMTDDQIDVGCVTTEVSRAKYARLKRQYELNNPPKGPNYIPG